MIFLLIVPYSLALTTSNCLPVGCGVGNTIDQCVSVTSSGVTLTGCKTGYFCDYSLLGAAGSWQNASCVYLYNTMNTFTVSQANLTTGYICSSNTECLSGNCQNQICIGSSKGTSCTASNQCATGFYCIESSKTCTALKLLGAACTIDDECAIGSVCSLSVCVPIFSLPIGASASNSAACVSNLAANNKCQNVQIYSNNNLLTYPYSCHLGSDCTYKLSVSDSTYYSGLCLCGGVNTTTGYCSEYTKYTSDVNQMLTEMQYSISDCAGNEAHSTDYNVLFMCGSLSQDTYFKYGRYMGQLLYVGMYSDQVLEYCSMSLGIFDQYYNFSPLPAGALVIKIGVLVVSYLI